MSKASEKLLIVVLHVLVYVGILFGIFMLGTGFVMWPEGVGFFFTLLALAGSLGITAIHYLENSP